jgi:sugar phosphate permease
MLTADSAPPGDARPTAVRYAVIFVAILMSLILYLDRFCVSFAERYIKEDLRLTETQMAFFLSGFFLTYALAQVPSGWLSDRFGARGILVLYILTWSLFTGGIGLATGFVFLIAMRFGCGIGQAGAYPTSAALLARWVPVTTRGMASSLVALGGRLGAAIAPILTGYLMLAFVPADTPVQFDAANLLNARALRDKLTSPSAAPAAAHVATLFSDEARNQLRTGKESTQTLIVELNSLLSRSDLFNESAFRSLSLPREALHALERRQAGDSLTSAQQSRFNRLLLEAVFPAEIGKLYTRGWRPVLLVYGIAGIIVAVLFWIAFRNQPSEHPWCNAAELELIEQGRQPEAASPGREPFPWLPILTSPTLWLDSLMQFMTNVGWVFLVTYLPRYLAEIHTVPIIPRAWMTSVPSFFGIAGMLLGGYLADGLARRIGLKWGRRLPVVITRLGAAVAYLVCLGLDAPWPATIAFAMAYFFTDLGIGAVWALKQDIGGRYVGAILGWGNMWGNIGAFAAPLYFNEMLGPSPSAADWNRVFLQCAVAYGIAGLSALGIDATIPIRHRSAGSAPATAT